jgi:hypothetical protein
MNNISKKLVRAVRHPLWSVRQVIDNYSRKSQSENRSSQADELFIKYGRMARAQGLSQLYVLLSFDCDTPEDITAAEHLDRWLRPRGIKATYAVPGAQLREGAEIFRKLAEMGSDFINHGGHPHAEWREGRYWSITFYHEMSSQEVVEDIQGGHEIFCRILGRTPVGFRAPHFGLFQAPEQHELIYDTLRKLGYHYSTSTLPEFGLNHGPLVDVGGLYEIPLSGSYAAPFSILDSWNYVESPYHPLVKSEYASCFIETVERFLTLGVPGVLNYYVDPAHVYKADPFYRAMEYLIEHNVQTIQFGWLLETVKQKE